MIIKKNWQKIDVELPLLLISGKDDPVGDMGKSVDRLFEFYVNKVGVKSVDTVLYEGVRHEYFNDTSKQKAFEKVLEFCDGLTVKE